MCSRSSQSSAELPRLEVPQSRPRLRRPANGGRPPCGSAKPGAVTAVPSADQGLMGRRHASGEAQGIGPLPHKAAGRFGTKGVRMKVSASASTGAGGLPEAITRWLLLPPGAAACWGLSGESPRNSRVVLARSRGPVSFAPGDSQPLEAALASRPPARAPSGQRLETHRPAPGGGPQAPGLGGVPECNCPKNPTPEGWVYEVP